MFPLGNRINASTSFSIFPTVTLECQEQDIIRLAEEIYCSEDPLRDISQILVFQNADSSLANLLGLIWSDKSHTETEKRAVVSKLSGHESFVDLLITLLETNPLVFIYTALALPQDAIVTCFTQFMKEEKKINFQRIAACIKLFLTPLWEEPNVQRTRFDDFFYLFEEDVIQEILQALQEQSTIEELGNLYALSMDEGISRELSSAFIEKFLPKKNYTRKLFVFIECVFQKAKTLHIVKKPEVLVQSMGKKIGKTTISKIITSHRSELSKEALIFSLWCMSDRDLEGFIKEINVDENADYLVELVDGIINLEIYPARRVSIMKSCINNFPEEQLLTFLDSALKLNSQSIPYICPALSQEAFATFIFVFHQGTRSEILRHSLTESTSCNRFLIQLRARFSEHVDWLISCATLDIVSQQSMELDGEQVGMMATFNFYIDAIEKAVEVNELCETMTIHQNDFQKVPPYLFASAMTQDAVRKPLIKAVPYMTNEQLSAFAQTLPKQEMIVTLDSMLKAASPDQMMTILESILIVNLEEYLRYKCSSMQEIFNQINENQSFFERSLLQLIEPSTVFENYYHGLIDEVSKTLSSQCNLIRKILAPLNYQLKKSAVEISETIDIENPEEIERIVVIVDSCVKLQGALSEKDGTFMQLKGLVHKDEEIAMVRNDIAIDMIPQDYREQNAITIESLKEKGLASVEDLKHLGMKIPETGTLKSKSLKLLTRYLKKNPQLDAIWGFFKKKHITSITDLYELGCIKERSEIFALINIAKKMEFDALDVNFSE